MLDEILKAAIAEGILGENKKVKKRLGRISEDLRKDYAAWKEEKEELDAEIQFKIDFKMKKARERIEKEIAEEYEQRFNKAAEKKVSLWQEIRDEIGIGSSVELNINSETGVISEWVEKKDKNKRF